MRNLYMYYKRIKVGIVKKQQAQAASGQVGGLINANNAAANKRSTSVASAGSNQSAVTSGSRALSNNSAPNSKKGGLDSDEDDGFGGKGNGIGNPEEIKGGNLIEGGGKVNMSDFMAKYSFKT